MEGTTQFIRRYRPMLLAYLDGVAPESTEEPGPLEFVEQVLEEWSRVSSGRNLEEPSPQERTFWFALYQLEELVENPRRDGLDPYEGVLMQNLAEIRELLRNRSGLPKGFFATRPGEDLGTL